MMISLRFVCKAQDLVSEARGRQKARMPLLPLKWLDTCYLDTIARNILDSVGLIKRLSEDLSGINFARACSVDLNVRL